MRAGEGHDRRSRAAGWPAERGGGGLDRRQGRRSSICCRPLVCRSSKSSAFVSPKWVPQMADAADVFAGISRAAGVRYTALVPNLAGLERAQAAGVTRDRDFRRRLRDLQPQEHQSDDRSVARQLPRGLRAGGGAGHPRARLRLDGVRLPVRRPGPSRARRRRCARPSSTWARSRCRSATPSASPIPDRSPAVVTAVADARAARDESRSTFTTRAARRSRTC